MRPSRLRDHRMVTVLQAHADLVNDYRSAKKAFERDLALVDDIAEARERRNRPGAPKKEPGVYDNYPSDGESTFLRRVASEFPDPADRRLITLLSQGEPSTAAAEALGVAHLPLVQ